MEGVGEWDSSEIPENYHPAPFFVEDVPGSWDTFLSLLAGISVKEVCKEHEAEWVRDLALGLVLLECCREGDDEKKDPGDSDFGPHFKIKNSNSRVELGSHEKIIDMISCESECFLEDKSGHIDEETHRISPDH